MSVLSLRQRLALELNRQLVEDRVQRHPLQQLFWESTLRCNMNCRHCGSDCKADSIRPDMPFDDFEKVLRRVKEVYDSHHIMVVISGGEPLMRKDLAECGRRIYELEFPWGMVTNGRALSRERFTELLRSGLRSMTVSLDGLEEDHNWMRGRNDSFQYASEAIRMAAAEPSIAFDVVTCVNRRNLAHLDEIKEHLISLGVKEWRLFSVVPMGRAKNDPELILQGEEFRQLMDYIVNTRKEGRIKASYCCEGFVGEYEGKVRDYLYECQAGTTVASVLIDGSISACTSVRGNYHQGNIYKDDFVEVWENGFGPYRDRSWMRRGECGDCKWFRYCQGNGMHLRDDEGNLIQCNLKKLYE